MGIVDSLFHRKKVHAKIKTDSIQYEGDIIISVAGNGKRFGGGMLVNPDAEVDDGLFDLCIVRWVSLFTFLRLLPLFIKGKHKTKLLSLIFERKASRSKRTVNVLLSLTVSLLKNAVDLQYYKKCIKSGSTVKHAAQNDGSRRRRRLKLISDKGIFRKTFA